MFRIPFDELVQQLRTILLQREFSEEDALLCATIFAENTLCGVASHGINRFPVLDKLISLGLVKPSVSPTLVTSFNALEVWNGNYGMGMKNAWLMTDRAMELAEKFGIGCVALRDTNHWMRAGTYGWKAAEKGFIFICWTNTIANLPPWGGKQARTGNNPLVFAVPHKPRPVVIDMALSQFSYGKLSSYRRAGKPLPFVGGYDSKGELSTDAGEIYSTFRALPIGLWKGAGLSLLLDLVAAVLSGGQTTKKLSEAEHESGLSQVFIAIDPKHGGIADGYNAMIEETLEYYKNVELMNEDELVVYPGERLMKTREENLWLGIPVEEEIWEKVLRMRD